MGAMPAGSGGRSAKLDDEAQAEVERRQEDGPWAMAAAMAYDDVIDPRELRNALLSGLSLASERIQRGRLE
jgi:acetyl-CoA carboxylase carboxyltransferase component